MQSALDNLKVRMKGLGLKLLFFRAKYLSGLSQHFYQSNTAFLYHQHPIIVPFVLNLRRRLGMRLHIKLPGADFAHYDKVIVPNGSWPEICEAAARIPEKKKVYCEVGFFPQNQNIYLDDKGIHGWSSVLDKDPPALTEPQRHELARFRANYSSRNFIRVRWDTLESSAPRPMIDSLVGTTPYFLVLLQLESDTAFTLCPFANNEALIEAVEMTLRGYRLVFKVHPDDLSGHYRVQPGNVLLPRESRDLGLLISHASGIVSGNSTAMLEALVHGKKCAALGVGFATNHGVTLECHTDLARLAELPHWEPDPYRVERFLQLLLDKQVNIHFWQSEAETRKLRTWLHDYGLLDASPGALTEKQYP